MDEVKVSPAEFARIAGVNDRTIRRGIKSGRLSKSLTKLPNGRMEIALYQGVLEWDSNKDLSKERALFKEQENPKMKKGQYGHSGNHWLSDEPPAEYMQAKSWNESIKAEREAVKLAEEKKILLPLKKIESEFAKIGMLVRSRLLSMRDELTDSLLTLRDRDSFDADNISKIIGEYNQELLEELAKKGENLV